ncbi:hypothetical protein GGF50DRAFT_119770 [Schizophyllum commune]
MPACWRTNPVVANELCYSTVVEKFLNIAMPARAEWIRTPLGETTLTLSARLPAPFQRDYSLPFGEIARFLSARSSVSSTTLWPPLPTSRTSAPSHYSCGASRGARSLWSSTSVPSARLHVAYGAPLSAAYVRSGGVAFDLPHGLLDDIYNLARQHGWRIDEIEKVVAGDRIWKRRTIGPGSGGR